MACLALGWAAGLAELKLLPLQKANEQEVCRGTGGAAGGKQERVAEGEGKEPVMTLILSCQLVFCCLKDSWESREPV